MRSSALDLLRRRAPLEPGGRQLRIAQAARRLVGDRRDRLSLRAEALGGAHGGGPVAGHDRVRQRPGGLLRRVDDHRLEVLGRHLTAGSRPDGEALDLGDQAHGPLPHALDQHASRGRVQAKAAALGLGDQTTGQVPRLRGRVAEDLAAGALHGLGQPLRGLLLRRSLAGRERHGQVGRQVAQRLDHRRRLLHGPALDAIGEQVAPRGHQGHRGNGSDERLGVGPARRSTRMLSSAPGPPSRSALARRRESAASILPSSVPAIR